MPADRHPDAILTEDFTADGATVTLSVVPDYDPESPRSWDNLGVMFCHHRRYDLGDVQIHPHDIERNHYDPEEVLKDLVTDHDPRVVIPLYLLDHSGLSIRAGAPRPGTASPFISDPQGWDTSMVGWIMDTAGTRERLGITGDTDSEDIAEILRSEVEVYDTYLLGGVVGWIVEDEDGDHLDSCHGYYDTDMAYSDGKDIALHHLAELGPKYRIAEEYRNLARSRMTYTVDEVPDDAEVEPAERDGVTGAWVTVRIFVPASDALEVLANPTPDLTS